MSSHTTMSEGIRLRYLLPALASAMVLAAGPIVAFLGTTTLARYLFVTVVALITLFFYHLRSWRKQVGVSLIVLALEAALLVVVYFQEQFPLKALVVSWLREPYAQLAWQVTVGISGAFLIMGVLILLWGIKAHQHDHDS